MTKVESILTKYLERLRLRTIEEQARKGILASGESAASLEATVKGNKGKLEGRGYFEFQQFGRNAGRKPPYQKIRDWLDDKSWSKRFAEEKKNSLAWAIRHNIGERGTLRGNTAQYPGLGFTNIVQEETEKLRLELPAGLGEVLASQIQRVWKELNK